MILALLACSPDLGPRSAQANTPCGSCHPEHEAAFATSRHAADPTGLFEELHADAAVVLGAEDTCDSCHRPDFGCLTCHAAAGNRGPSQGQLLHDPTGPVRAARDAGGPHATTASAFLVDSALCGTCHDVDAPLGFAEHPYQVWLDSPAAGEGQTCQTCHMEPASYGTDHRFPGIARGDEAALDLLMRGLLVEGDRVTNVTGHLFPDGASWSRELWIETDVTEPLPLHPVLRADGVRVASPVEAFEREVRALQPGESLVFEGATEICLRYRPVSGGLAEQFGLDGPSYLRCY